MIAPPTLPPGIDGPSKTGKDPKRESPRPGLPSPEACQKGHLFPTDIVDPITLATYEAGKINLSLPFSYHTMRTSSRLWSLFIDPIRQPISNTLLCP
ncbi:hypothetical protein QYF36_026045 [Acer negundo]|nr:hypothetical protein QYF36_008984 [Acer negundo]KAK4839925.1 hypothetical protein QYF36_026045 [Acer negundo]